MPASLPSRPNLEHLRSQAKTLLAKLRAGDDEASRAFTEHLPGAAGLTPAEVRQRGFRLADAQAVVARRTGFAAWPGLARHVERLRSLEGTWAFRSLETDGTAVPAAMLASSQLLIDGDRFRMESAEGSYEGVFTIDVDAVPHRIDIAFNEGPEAGNRCEGLFELDGDRLAICLGLVGASRPAAFVTTTGSGHALEHLERVHHSRPDGVDGGTPPAGGRPGSRGQTAADDFGAAMTPTLERLQGEWSPRAVVTSGNELPTAMLKFGRRTHAGTDTKVVFGGQAILDALVRVREDASPTEIDYLLTAGASAGAICKGLFRWDGDVAEFCMAAPGDPRPADFTCPHGSGRTLTRWTRRS